MTEELIDWGRACIYIWNLSLTWIYRLPCGIPMYKAGRLPAYPFLSSEVVPWLGAGS